MNKIIVGLVILIILFAGGFLLLSNFRKTNLLPSEKTMNKEDSMAKDAKMEGKTVEGYQGRVLAGNSSPFLEFNKEDYEKAKNEGKIILLDFYATWCPICRAEAPEIDSGFNSLTTDQVVGFRVNFNDPDTDSDEKDLAREFNIPYQHTKVIIKNGKEISRSADSWKKEDFLSSINNAIK